MKWGQHINSQLRIIREKVLKDAIFFLTEGREESAVVPTSYMDKLWEESFEIFQKHTSKFRINIDSDYKEKWLDLQKSKIGKKSASDLKVIYLCGPEPLNDLKVLLENGIRREHIWAIEVDTNEYKRAVVELKEVYPFIKIFKGKVETFFDIYPEVYDIIYLDACASLPNEKNNTHKILNIIFNKQKLSELSVLITNFSHPDETNHSLMEEYVDILSSFYFSNKIPFKNDDGDVYTVNSLQSEGDKHTYEEVKEIIRNNFTFYYESFITRFIYEIASFYSPYSKAFSNTNSASMFFKMNKLNNNFSKEISQLIGKDFDITNSFGIHNSDEYPQQYFLHYLKNNNIDWMLNFFTEKGNKTCCISDSIKLVDYLMRVVDYLSIESSNIISDLLRDEIKSAISSENFFDSLIRYSCDVPGPQLLLQLLIYQVGYPYHMNTSRLERFNYTAKNTKMYTDLFVFDKCRYLYDWIPTVDLFSDGFKKIEIQIISRIIINRLNKLLNNDFHPIFDYGNFFGIYEEREFGFETIGIAARNEIVPEDISRKSSITVAESILIEIKEKLLAFSEREEAHILFKSVFPFGSAYLTLEDPNNDLINEIFKVRNNEDYTKILSRSDNNLYVSFSSHQTLEISKRHCEIVQKILKRYGINSILKEHID